MASPTSPVDGDPLRMRTRSVDALRSPADHAEALQHPVLYHIVARVPHILRAITVRYIRNGVTALLIACVKVAKLTGVLTPWKLPNCRYS